MKRLIRSKNYSGEDRRSDEPEICVCSNHSDLKDDVRSLQADVKAKVSSRIFIACVLIFVGMCGIVYERIHSVDKQVTEILTRQAGIKETVSALTDEVHRLINELREDINRHER